MVYLAGRVVCVTCILAKSDGTHSRQGLLSKYTKVPVLLYQNISGSTTSLAGVDLVEALVTGWLQKHMSR